MMTLGLMVVWCVPANAHTRLVSTDLPDGSSLPSPPSSVTLTFSNAVLPDPLVAELRSSAGADAVTLTVDVTHAQVVIHLGEVATDTVNVLTWEVRSADRHTVTGTIRFSVGDPPDSAARLPGWTDTTTGITAVELLIVGSRWVWLVCLLTAFGAVVFASRVLRNLPDHPASVQPVLHLAVVGCGAAGLAMLAASSTGLAGHSVAQFEAAHGWWLAAAASFPALLLSETLLARRRYLAAEASGVLALVPPSLAGHFGDHPVSIVSHATHLGAAGIWLGGIAALVLQLRRWSPPPARKKLDPDTESNPAGEALLRFSRLATVALVAVAGSGLVLAVIAMGDVSDLWETPYGRLIIFKVTLVVAAAAMGDGCVSSSPRSRTWLRH